MIESVRVSPDGRWLALAANSPEHALVQIVRVGPDGALGPARSWRLGDLGFAERPGAPRGGIDATLVDWHPSGRVLAVSLNTRDQVLFLRAAGVDDGRLELEPWGAPVTVGRDPFVGRFTPDGGHYISANWGRDFQAPSIRRARWAVPTGRAPRA